MKTRISVAFAMAAVLLAACGGSVELPKGTTLGDLVKVESKDVMPAEGREPFKPKPGDTLYVLYFENIKSFSFKDSAETTGALHSFPLVDSNGKEYRPAHFGTPAADGSISGTGITFGQGELKASGGRFYAETGTVTIDSGKLVVVYSVPKDASSLAWRDGDKKHPIQ